MNRNAAAGHQDMGACKVVVLAQRSHRAFVNHVARGKFAAAHAGVGKQRTETTVDIDAVVALGGTGMHRQGVEFFFVLLEVQGHGLQGQGALLEIHRHEVFAANPAAILNSVLEIEGVVVGMGDDLAVNGAWQSLGGLFADPLAGNETFQD